MPVPASIPARRVPERRGGLQAGSAARSSRPRDCARPADRRHGGRRLCRVAALAVLIGWLATLPVLAGAAPPQGVWLIDGKVAVQIFDCKDRLCGRIVWLIKPRNLQGELDRDKKNRDPALRQRRLCGLTILWGLRPVGPDRWGDGWFYNPDDGNTYRISAQLTSPDVITARIYVRLPLFGRTKTLRRVAHGISAGWC